MATASHIILIIELYNYSYSFSSVILIVKTCSRRLDKHRIQVRPSCHPGARSFLAICKPRLLAKSSL